MLPDRPLPLLLFQSGGSLGGTELMNFRLWQKLDRRRFQVDVCCLDEPGEVSAMYQAAGYNPCHLHAPSRSLPQVWRAIRQVVQAQPYAVIYLFGLRVNLLGRLAGHFYTQARLVTGQRSVDGWRRPWHNWLDRRTSPWVSLYIANCRTVEAWLHSTVGISPARTVTIHSGLDSAPFQHARRGQLRAELGLPDEAVVVTCVANLRPVKNHALLLRAAARLPAVPSVHLLMVGGGPLRAELVALAGQLGLTERVHWLGSRQDIPAILADTDIKVLASDWEGLPGALLEAMAAGCPVVATDVGGVSELLVNGETGFLTPPGDAEALAAALSRLVTDPALRHRLGEAGRRRAREHFDLAHQVVCLEEQLMAVAVGSTARSEMSHV